MRSFARPGIIAALMLVGAPAVVMGQAGDGVSNLAETSETTGFEVTGTSQSSPGILATGFRVGTHTDGYDVQSVTFNIESIGGSGTGTPRVTIHADTASTPDSASLYTFECDEQAPSGTVTCTNSSSARLDPDTSYHAVVSVASGDPFTVSVTASDDQTGVDLGDPWTIHDSGNERTDSGWVRYGSDGVSNVLKFAVAATKAQPTVPSLAFPPVGIGVLPLSESAIILFYPVGVPITPTTLPAAINGTDPVAYQLAAVPFGLTFNSATRVLTGTADAPTAEFSVAYTALDSATPHASASLDVFFNVCPTGAMPDGATSCPAPAYTSLALTAPDDLIIIIDEPLPPLTLPAATGGTEGGTAERPTRIYSINPVPRGLDFNQSTRVFSGKPDGRIGLTPRTLTYEVRDVGSPPSIGRSAMATFEVTPRTRPGIVDVPATQTYTVGEPVDLTLPTAAGAADPNIIYALVGPNGTDLSELPGLTFDPATRTLSGTPTTAATAREFRYTATLQGVAGFLTISITVEAGAVPPLSVNAGDDQTVTVGDTVTVTATVTGANTPDADLTARWGVVASSQPAVAAATSGAFIGTIGASTGLTLTFTAPTLTTTTPLTFPVIITVTDPNGAEGMATVTDEVSITIMPAAAPEPTGYTLAVSPTTVTESETATDLTATVTLVGGTFGVERVFQITTPGGTATSGTDYTAVSGVTLTIPATMTTGSSTGSFEALAETVTETDGETVVFAANLLVVDTNTIDETFGTAPTASITINDPVAGPEPTSITLSVDPATVTESNLPTQVTITATLVGGAFSEQRRMRFRSADGTAREMRQFLQRAGYRVMPLLGDRGQGGYTGFGSGRLPAGTKPGPPG